MNYRAVTLFNIISFAFLIAVATFGCGPANSDLSEFFENRLNRDDVEQIKEMVEEDIRQIVTTTYVEELESILPRILVKMYEGENDFFRSRPQFDADLLRNNRRKYQIRVNKAIDQVANPPPEARKAILVHELAHTVYYTKLTTLELLALARIVNPTVNEKFEKGTDLVAIEKGFAQGLSAYRVWVYEQFEDNPEQLLRTKKNYYNPEQIRLLEIGLREFPERDRGDRDIYHYWQNNVPLTLEDIARDLQNFRG